MINARAETFAEKAFKRLVGTRRCLVPANGFYEWRREGKHKVPVWIRLKSREPFAFAGLWDFWRDPESDKELCTFTIIATEAKGLLRRCHTRMPVIYDKEMGEQWFDPRFVGTPLRAVLQPFPSELMEAQDVSMLVNSPANDIPECIEPVSP